MRNLYVVFASLCTLVHASILDPWRTMDLRFQGVIAEPDIFSGKDILSLSATFCRSEQRFPPSSTFGAVSAVNRSAQFANWTRLTKTLHSGQMMGHLRIARSATVEELRQGVNKAHPPAPGTIWDFLFVAEGPHARSERGASCWEVLRPPFLARVQPPLPACHCRGLEDDFRTLGQYGIVTDTTLGLVASSISDRDSARAVRARRVRERIEQEERERREFERHMALATTYHPHGKLAIHL